MKTKLLIIIGMSLIGTIVLPANAQYMGNLNQYDGNHTSQELFPSEPLSFETLEIIKKIILSDETIQKIIDGKIYSIIDGNAYLGSTGTGEWNPIVMLNVNNETTISVLVDLNEKKILKIDSNKLEKSFPPSRLGSEFQYSNEVNYVDFRNSNASVNLGCSDIGLSSKESCEIQRAQIISVIGIAISAVIVIPIVLFNRKRK